MTESKGSERCQSVSVAVVLAAARMFSRECLAGELPPTFRLSSIFFPLTKNLVYCS